MAKFSFVTGHPGEDNIGERKAPSALFLRPVPQTAPLRGLTGRREKSSKIFCL